MRLERIVGLFFISALLIFLMFIFYPKDLSNNNTADLVKAKKIEIEVTKDKNFNEFVETDFDFFVYRAHVLSSKKNADILKNEIEEGGYPAFIENLENGYIEMVNNPPETPRLVLEGMRHFISTHPTACSLFDRMSGTHSFSESRPRRSRSNRCDS